MTNKIRDLILSQEHVSLAIILFNFIFFDLLKTLVYQEGQILVMCTSYQGFQVGCDLQVSLRCFQACVRFILQKSINTRPFKNSSLHPFELFCFSLLGLPASTLTNSSQILFWGGSISGGCTEHQQ